MRPDVWLEWGQHDLNAAQACMETGENHIACYLAAQSAEKGLKAVIEYIGESVQRTHSLVALHGQLLAAGCRLDLPEQMLLSLTRHATDARYPRGGDYMPEELYGPGDAHAALESARHVHATCRGALSDDTAPGM